MTVDVDLGRPVALEGTCPHCRLEERPLWGREGRIACAACWTRLIPGKVLGFQHGRPVALMQATLPLEGVPA